MEVSAVRSQFLAGLAFGLLIFALISLRHGKDPAVLLAAGEANPSTPYLVETMGRDIPLRGFSGHDGQAYYLQALDPLFITTTRHIMYADRPAYRAQRVLYPLVVGLGGVAPAPLIPWLMGMVSALSYGVGTAAVGLFALKRGLSPWLGLAFLLNLGMLLEFGVGGAGIMAFALACAALPFLLDGRLVAASALFAASALTREVMVVFIAGAVLYWMYEHRRLPFILVLPTAVAGLGWFAYVRVRIDEPTNTPGIHEIQLPFNGIADSYPIWLSTGQLPMIFFLVVFFVVAATAAIAKPSPLTWGAGAFIGLSLILGAFVWKDFNDIMRITAPVFTSAVFFVLSRTGAFVPSGHPSSEQRGGVEIPAMAIAPVVAND